MTIHQGYCTQTELKLMLGLPTSDANDNTLLDIAIESASRVVDDYCRRKFYTTSTAVDRTFRAVDPTWLYVDDFQPSSGAYVVTVATDDDNDGTAETVWTETVDYTLGPVNDINLFAKYRNVVTAVGSRSFPTSGVRARVTINAKWGWAATPDPVKYAAMILAEDLFKSKDAPFGVAGFGDYGAIRIRQNPKAMELLEPYRLAPVVM